MGKRTKAAGGARQRTNRRGRYVRKEKEDRNRSGSFFLWLQAIVSILLMLVLLMLNMLPLK